MGDLFEIVDRGIPVWILIIFVIGVIVGRLWQWTRDKIELERQINLIAELVGQLHHHITPTGASPLAKAIIAFQQSAFGVSSALANKIQPLCIHGDHPDDCPTCRH